MSITRYDPFRDLKTLQDEVNRLFSTNFSRGFGDEGLARGVWTPNVDIFENKDEIVLEAELPGMSREDFELTIENNVLTLRGERRIEIKGESAEGATTPKTIEAQAETPGAEAKKRAANG